jgi:hypothetical protein
MEKLNIINQLLNEIQTISESYKRVAEATGENFNIFSVLQMERNEVRTHSRFLAELLNPKGNHGQKDVFLKKFVELLNIKDFETASAIVKVEFYIGKKTEDSGGRIDIRIKDNRNHVILVENKIDAIEQKNQLTRYNNSARTDNLTLLFLTLEGQESKDPNMTLEKYHCISYKSDILNWLEECRKESVSSPMLRETITQYINLIKTLTGQNINTKMSLEITNRVIKDEQSFDAFVKLLQSKEEIKNQILNSFLLIIKDIAKDNKLNLHLNEVDLLASKKAWKRFYFSNNDLEKLELQLCFEFRNQNSGYKNWGFGFRSEKETVNISHKFEEQYDRIKEKFDTDVQKGTLYYITWQLFDNYSDWEDFETLKNIKFGNFKSDFEKKVVEMLDIIKSIQIS